MRIAMKRGMAVMLCLAMVAALFIGVPCMIVTAEETNVSTGTPLEMTNSDFEAVVSNPYWSVSDSAQVKIETGAGRNGSSALHISDINKADGSGRGFNAASSMFEVQPGTSITASVYAKGISSFMVFTWVRADGTTYNSAQVSIPEAAEWTLATNTKIVPDDAVYAKVLLGTGLAAVGDAYFDDVSVRGTKINVRNTNLPGFLVAQNYNIAGQITTTYDAATDTASVTTYGTSGAFLAGGRENLKSSAIPTPANTIFVVEFTLANSVKNGTQTTQGWVHVYDATNATTVGSIYYGSGNANGQKGDGFYSYEFTTLGTDTADLQLQVRPRKDFNGSYDLSGLTVYAKTGEFLGGDFEPQEGISGWTPNSAANVFVQTGDGVGHSGNNALCITDARDDAGYNAESAKFPAIPGQSYTASVYFKGDCDGQLYLAFYDAEGNRVGINGVMPTASSDWTLVTNTFTAPDGAVSGAVILATGKAITGTVYFDDVAVQLNCMHPNEADFTVVEPATCYKAGKKSGTCSICNKAGLEFEIPMLEHEWVNGTVVTPASCGNPGVIRYDCKFKADGCTAHYDEDIPLDEHEPVYVAAKPATTDADGCKEHYECKCGAWFQDAEAYFEITDKGSYIIAKTGVTEDTEEDKTPEGDASKDEPHPTGDTAVLLLMGVLMVASCGFVVATKVKFGYRR